MTRLFTYDFEFTCILKPIEPLPARAGMIARDIYRLPELSIGPDRNLRTSAADLVPLADWRGVEVTNAYVKRQWQIYYNVRTMPGGAARA